MNNPSLLPTEFCPLNWHLCCFSKLLRPYWVLLHLLSLMFTINLKNSFTVWFSRSKMKSLNYRDSQRGDCKGRLDAAFRVVSFLISATWIYYSCLLWSHILVPFFILGQTKPRPSQTITGISLNGFSQVKKDNYFAFSRSKRVSYPSLKKKLGGILTGLSLLWLISSFFSSACKPFPSWCIPSLCFLYCFFFFTGKLSWLV